MDNFWCEKACRDTKKNILSSFTNHQKVPYKKYLLAKTDVLLCNNICIQLFT